MAEHRTPLPDGSDEEPTVDPHQATRRIRVLEAVFLGLIGLLLVALVILAVASMARG